MPPELTLALVGVAGLLYYAVQCWWRPLVDCWCCKGAGRHRKGKFSRRCRMCRGQGDRWRTAVRLWHRLRA